MPVYAPAESPKPDKDEASNEMLLHEPESNKSTIHHTCPLKDVVLIWPLTGEVCHLKWRLMKVYIDHWDIFYMYAELGDA